MNQTKIVLSYLALSVVGAALLVVLVSMTPVPTSSMVLPEKIFVAGVFILSCIFGISFTLRPNWVRPFIFKKNDTIKNHTNALKRSFRGHHPDCKIFENHTIIHQNKTWCAGCLGLLIGCLLSIILMILYVLVPFQQLPIIPRLLLFLGLLVIALVYLEIILGSRHSIIHILSNGMLVLSFFFITTSIVELSGKSVYGFFTILLCILWLDTRIQLSRWHHRRLCSSCLQPCKIYVATIIFGK
ncbi:MAG: hypothetical protein MUO73_06380 [Thermoplasmata archaeon]|nr:hypothetical protein [Thermoplasmata archaeon]